MIIVAAILFAIVAILGIILLSYVLREKKTPRWLVYSHGPLAVVGIILLIIYAGLNRPSPIASIIIFLIAATFGFVLFYRDVTGKSLPKGVALGHGLIAFLGLLAFLIFFLSAVNILKNI